MARSPLLQRLIGAVRRSAPRPQSGLSRRELVALGLAAAAAPAWKCTTPTYFGGRTVIIGGGIAGLHCGLRLAEVGVPVQVYEAADRVGGRMFTARGLFASGQLSGEFGGEFIDTGHLTMIALADELGIALDDRFAFDEPDMIRDTWWVLGRQVDESEVVAQFTAVAPAIAAAFEAAETSDADYEALSDTSLDDFLLDVCDPAVYPELYEILTAAYRGEYGRETTEQGCLNLVYLIDSTTPDPFRIFGDSDERYHANLGNDTFTTALADALGWDKITLSSPVTKVKTRKKGGFEVTLASGVVDKCDNVVFAVPFSTLREIDTDKLDEIDDDKRAVIDELSYGTNAKVIAGFTRRLWRDDLNQFGTITSDLSFQQVWDSTIGQPEIGAGVLTNYLGGLAGEDLANVSATDHVAAFLPELAQVWPGVDLDWDGTAEKFDWPTYEWTKGSYACYTVGQWAFYGEEGRRTGNVHYCGEHTSLDFQGYMEGGAETGALVAAEILADYGLARSSRHDDAIGTKLLAPQVAYQAVGSGRLNPLRRKREARATLRRLLGR